MLVGTLFFLFPPHFFNASAVDTTFEVNVREVLSVAITTPTTWANGNINTLLRNKVVLNVTSNNIDGFTASMISTDANSRLYHSSRSSEYLTPLSSTNVTPASFTANSWGFSINDTDAGSSESQYNPVASASSAPTTLISQAQSTASTPITSRNIYFGAMSNISRASGTYSGTVTFYVVSGNINNDSSDPDYNPNPPVNPATDVANGTTETDATNSRTVSTVVTTNGNTSTTTTTVNEYVAPQGVTNSTSSNIYDGSMLTTGLAVTAAIAATSGLTFFILAKRKKDDDDEEETE